MNTQRFTGIWNYMRLVVITGAFCIFVGLTAYTYAFGEGFAPNLEVEYNQHEAVHNTDYGQQQEAREESERSGEPQVYEDSSGNVHVYVNGGELA